VRDAVAGGELAQPVGVAAETGADDPDPDLQLLECLSTPEQQLEDEVAEDELPADEGAERLGGHDEHAAGLAYHAGCADRLAGEQVELDHQIAGSLCDQLAFLAARVDEHRHRFRSARPSGRSRRHPPGTTARRPRSRERVRAARAVQVVAL
jgi:hypothetical protein